MKGEQSPSKTNAQLSTVPSKQLSGARFSKTFFQPGHRQNTPALLKDAVPKQPIFFSLSTWYTRCLGFLFVEEYEESPHVLSKKIVAFKNKAFFLNGSGPQMKANTCYNTGWLLLWLRFYDLFVKYLIGTALNVPFQIGRKGGSVIFLGLLWLLLALSACGS